MTDRSQAMALVEAALTSGRIVQADRDMRIDQIKNATSQQDVDLVVRDLQPAVAAAAAAPTVTVSAGAPAASTPQQPWPLVNYGPGQGQSQAAEVAQLVSGASKKIGGVIAIVVFLSVVVPIVGVIIGLVSASDKLEDINFGSPVDETTYDPGQEPGENGVNLFTVDGFGDLVSALDDKADATAVFSATIYPRYAVLSVPEQPTGRRYVSHYWDGQTLVANDFKSTSDSPRIDLGQVRPEVVIGLIVDVRACVDSPTTWYASIDAIASEGPRIAAYATNEYGESCYVLADLDGNVTYESSSPS